MRKAKCKISERWLSDLSPESKDHLLSSLNNLRNGVPPTPSFKLYGKSDWTIVTDFLNQISVSSLVPEWLLQYEVSRKEKWGPQGGHAPWKDLRENARLYFSRPQSCHDFHDRTVDKYGKFHLSMISATDALKTLKSQDKIETRAAGWDTFQLKKTDPVAQQRALYLIRTGKWKKGFGYFFSRYNKLKKRLFVPMPFSSMIRQAQWFNSFLLAIQEDLRTKLHKSEFIFWGDKIGFNHLFHDILEPLIKSYDPKHLVFVMRDFDKMDTTMGPEQKSKLFIPKLLKAYNYSNKSQAASLVREAMLFSNVCPIATPEGMWTGNHGEASGATVTNGGETCANESYADLLQNILETLLLQEKLQLKLLCSFGNGDDGLSIYYLDDVSTFDRAKELIKTAASQAAEKLGFVIQAEKWDIHLGTYGKYCQYLVAITDKLRAMYPASLILNSIVNPEKEYTKKEWDRDYYDLSIIQKLAQGRELPYFHQLIDYVDNGMKFRLLGQDGNVARRILSKYDKYRALQDSSRKFNYWNDNTDELHGIENNPVVIYLFNKRGWKL